MNLITEIDFYQIFDMFMLLLIGMGPKIANLLLNGILDKKASPRMMPWKQSVCTD